ncbi:MAG: RdgB/HAM1 family non-canonical purine NTP pyrophosphatase [Myxococcaceae bacterium]
MKPKLLFATTNEGKLKELRALVGDAVEVLSLKDFPAVTISPETGDTFEANAEQKALHYAKATKTAALADDSGLCVDALGGAPGIHSARYVEGSDADRTQRVLEVMREVPEEKRGAQFRCALCLALPSGKTVIEVGEMKGKIGHEPRGTNGFGYDPIFVLVSGKTTAELTQAQKSALSHRGEAFRKMRPHLEAWATGRLR